MSTAPVTLAQAPASTTSARELAERFVPVAATRALGGERDANLLIEASDGERYVLKLVGAPEAEESIPLQIAALDHLARAAPDLNVPRVVRARGGEATLATPDGAAWMLTFHPGALLSDAPARAATLAALGATAGRLSRALAGFDDPRLDRALEWGVERAGDARRWLRDVADPALKTMAERALSEGAETDVRALPRQAIHGDLNPHNVIVGERGDAIGIIDFGDMHRAPRIGELAVAAAYHLGGSGEAAAAIITGFARAVALTPAERMMLPALIAARLGMTVAITARRAAERPADAGYLLRNLPAAAAGLAWLEEGGRARLREIIEAAA